LVAKIPLLDPNLVFSCKAFQQRKVHAQFRAWRFLPELTDKLIERI